MLGVASDEGTVYIDLFDRSADEAQRLEGKLVVVAGQIQPPAGAGTGLLTATTGTGGLLLAPVLLATGLRGERFVATGAVIASAIHVTRIGTYGAGGMLSGDTLLASLLLAAGIVAGNLLGTRLRRVVTEATTMRVTWVTLAVAMAFALLGVG